MNSAVLLGTVVTAIALCIPLLLAALGEIVVEKAGVINVGIEGMMLIGAYSGYAASFTWHSAGLGALAAMLAGSAAGLLFALMSLVLEANQVVVGTAINILALGSTDVFYQGLLKNSTSVPHVDSFHSLPIPFLSKMPVVGPALFDQNLIGYFAFLLIPVVSLFLSKTRAGLQLRAVGEYPPAADVAGVSVRKTRAAALAFGGAMAGLAGAYLSIAYTVAFTNSMTGGKGFIALAVVIVGRWSPVGALFAALLFGFANALQFQFQSTSDHLPYQLLLALPYILTLGALVINAGRTAAPARLGELFQR